MVASVEEFWVKVALAIFMIIMGLLFVRKGREEAEMKSKKYFKYGLAMFALMTSLTRIFFLVTDGQTVGTDIYNFFWKAAVVSSMFALIFILLVIETYLVKAKYVFTAIAIIGTVLIIVVDIPLAQILNVPLYFALGGEIFALYLYLIIKLSGNLRTKSLLMLISLFVFSAGILFDSEAFTNALFSADLGLIGAILMWVGLGYYLKLNY